MSKPTIFTISATWDAEANVWSGHSDDIPAAADDAPTLDELLVKISAMALDLLPENHPEIDPATLYLQITALSEAKPAAVDGQKLCRTLQHTEPSHRQRDIAPSRIAEGILSGYVDPD